MQDLYVKELKAYKAPPAAKDAHLTAVKTFSAPKAPSSPSPITADLASDLTTFEASPVDLATPAASTEGASKEMTVPEMLAEMRKPVPLPMVKKWRNSHGEVIGLDGKPHPAYNDH